MVGPPVRHAHGPRACGRVFPCHSWARQFTVPSPLLLRWPGGWRLSTYLCLFPQWLPVSFTPSPWVTSPETSRVKLLSQALLSGTPRVRRTWAAFPKTPAEMSVREVRSRGAKGLGSGGALPFRLGRQWKPAIAHCPLSLAQGVEWPCWGLLWGLPCWDTA
jgi:hypothetical protein